MLAAPSLAPGPGDLDDAECEHFSRRVLVAVGSKANPALLDGLPCSIEGLSQDFHLVSVEGASERVPRQHPEHALPSLNHLSATLTKISRVLKGKRLRQTRERSVGSIPTALKWRALSCG
jgi:hypothetical protein